MLRSLSQIDPREAWRPASTKTWDLKWAAHLFRRAGFGFPARSLDGETPAWERLQGAVKQGQKKTIDELLAGGDGQKEFDALMDAAGDQLSKVRPRRFYGPQPQKMQGWWLYRMLNTPHPLKERLTLFWHDHFATSLAKVAKSELMFLQNTLLRKHALGGFRPLLTAIGRDPAMLIWLDSNSNVKGKPNENYGRELLELFSLGEGNYTERDLQEAARAFTGWSTVGGKYVFNADRHDAGQKTFLGKTGNFNGDDIVNIVLKQPACARFLVRKLFAEFISESESPPARLLEPLAQQLLESDYDIGLCMSTMLRSNLFFSPLAYRARIKSPVEYVVGTVGLFDGDVSMERLAQSMDGLGQTLFAPPNVKGWDGGKTWLNTAKLVARHNLAAKMIGGGDRQFAKGINATKLATTFAGKKATTDAQAKFLLNLLLQGDVDPAVEKCLVDFARTKSDMQAVAHTIMTIPEFQLA